MSAVAAGRPTLVALHAFGSSGAAWTAMSAALPQGAAVLAPDLPGFAGADDLPAPTVAAYADWVAALVEREGAERAVLVGWSMGGKISMALAARRPPWLAGLALVAPSPPSPEPMDEADRETQLAGWGDAALADRETRSLAPEPGAWVHDAVETRLAVSERAWRWWLTSGSREDLDLGPEPLDVPALVIVGGSDENLGEAAQRRLTLPRLRSPRLERLQDCGHLLPLEAPGRLAAVLGSWLHSLDG